MNRLRVQAQVAMEKARKPENFVPRSGAACTAPAASIVLGTPYNSLVRAA